MNYRLPLAIVLLCYQTVIRSEEVTNDVSDSTNDESLYRVRRSGLSMLRLGRGLQMLRLGKRALPMLRLGRSVSDGFSNEDIQYILSLMRNDRQVPLPRYGKDLAFQNMLMNALKNAEMRDIYDDVEPDYNAFGYELDTTPERQIRPAPRPGRYRRSTDASITGEQADKQDSSDSKYQLESTKQQEARVAPLMRYGKELTRGYNIDSDELDMDDDEIDENVVKRAMRMLRLGRGMRMLRLGKRPMDSEDYTQEDKRALRLLRLGKRPFKMLRLGRSDNEEEKRALRLLRLGKRSDS